MNYYYKCLKILMINRLIVVLYIRILRFLDESNMLQYVVRQSSM